MLLHGQCTPFSLVGHGVLVEYHYMLSNNIILLYRDIHTLCVSVPPSLLTYLLYNAGLSVTVLSKNTDLSMQHTNIRTLASASSLLFPGNGEDQRQEQTTVILLYCFPIMIHIKYKLERCQKKRKQVIADG